MVTTFRGLIKLHCPLESSEATATAHSALTYEEINAIRYAAGYVPRALKKKLTKSPHPLKEDLQVCLLDLLDDGHKESNESQDWIALINRGGLTRINHNTFQLFLAMEHELHNSKGVRKQLPKPTTKNDSSTQEDIDHE